MSVSDVRAAVAGATSASDGGASEEDQTRYSPPIENDGKARFRPAAVLCAVYADNDGQACVILTRRSRTLRSHTGEVSFPGGRMDHGETPEQTALREAHEEVGIDPDSVEVVGRLASLSTWARPSRIVPVVGVLPGAPELVPNPAEVDRAFSVRIAELFADGVGHEERWSLGELTDRPMYFFALAGDTVWGATARILRDLLEAVWSIRS